MIDTLGWFWSLVITGSVIVGSLTFVLYFDARWRR